MSLPPRGADVLLVSFLVCPKCQTDFYVDRLDYRNEPAALAACPRCGLEFPVREGNPKPPLEAGAQ